METLQLLPNSPPLPAVGVRGWSAKGEKKQDRMRGEEGKVTTKVTNTWIKTDFCIICMSQQCFLCVEQDGYTTTHGWGIVFFLSSTLQEQCTDPEICSPDFLAWGCWLGEGKSNRLINTLLFAILNGAMLSINVYCIIVFCLFIYLIITFYPSSFIFQSGLHSCCIQSTQLGLCLMPRVFSRTYITAWAVTAFLRWRNRGSFIAIKCTWQIKWSWFLFVIFLRASPKPWNAKRFPMVT